MILHEAMARAGQLFPVREQGTGWAVQGTTEQHPTKAQALAAAAVWKIERVLLEYVNEISGTPEDVLRAAHLARAYHRTGGDWRDYTRATLRQLQGRTTASERRTALHRSTNGLD